MKRLLFVLVIACHAPPAVERDAGASAECTKLGATCTFAPGKLGTCVEVEHTSGASSFVCQSQH